MWAEGDIVGNESEKIAVAWSGEKNLEKEGGGSPVDSTQLASERMSSTRKIQEVVEERDSGGYEEAWSQ